MCLLKNLISVGSFSLFQRTLQGGGGGGYNGGGGVAMHGVHHLV